jgi:hypothetical protein
VKGLHTAPAVRIPQFAVEVEVEEVYKSCYSSVPVGDGIPDLQAAP